MSFLLNFVRAVLFESHCLNDSGEVQDVSTVFRQGGLHAVGIIFPKLSGEGRATFSLKCNLKYYLILSMVFNFMSRGTNPWSQSPDRWK